MREGREEGKTGRQTDRQGGREAGRKKGKSDRKAERKEGRKEGGKGRQEGREEGWKEGRRKEGQSIFLFSRIMEFSLQFSFILCCFDDAVSCFIRRESQAGLMEPLARAGVGSYYPTGPME